MGEETRPGTPAAAKSFEQRLEEARAKSGMGPQPVSDGAIDRNSFGLVMRVGVELVSAVVVGAAIGWGLDRWLGMRPLFLILFVLLGGVAGIVNVWRLVAPDPGTR
ncbi:AtpZ/AtpI family protein [Lichenicoccus sp.]|uniref:AtpZ/AtpI family protein n=1 Tax=Lichenicoccus sp. TaxID=2781899 RepID=UPI003D1115A3